MEEREEKNLYRDDLRKEVETLREKLEEANKNKEEQQRHRNQTNGHLLLPFLTSFSSHKKI